MRRGRSGIAAELVPLVLILACLAGSLALVIAIHRRFVSAIDGRKALRCRGRDTLHFTAPRAKPLDRPAPVAPPTPEVDEPEPPPPAPLRKTRRRKIVTKPCRRRGRATPRSVQG